MEQNRLGRHPPPPAALFPCSADPGFEPALIFSRWLRLGSLHRVSGVFQRLRYWGPLVLWMGVIFWASADSGSGRRGSRILGPLLRWLMPGASGERIDAVLFFIRKVAHVTEYAI
ncbi:MAG: hypothetical protein RJB04_2364, partial [Verrucomicrobiota bacterium]